MTEKEFLEHYAKERAEFDFSMVLEVSECSEIGSSDGTVISSQSVRFDNPLHVTAESKVDFDFYHEALKQNG